MKSLSTNSPTRKNLDTIAAIATPPGYGGVGIVRISGPLAQPIAIALLGSCPQPRLATYTDFTFNEVLLDKGIALFFKGPHSYTGDDVLELQGHGGPIVLQQILQATVAAGARLAGPGEFSEQAFLNGKIDLTQAEATADLINAHSEQAAALALKTLTGSFSDLINEHLGVLTECRMLIEATLDFPEEETDTLEKHDIIARCQACLHALEAIAMAANQGAKARAGLELVIAGKPNAGKSSLLNSLSERDSAIVTDIAGTTRDVLREYIQINGVALHVLDTAGLRESDDVVEQAGVSRAKAAILSADLVLVVLDETDPAATCPVELKGLSAPTIVVHNKIDLIASQAPTCGGQPREPLLQDIDGCDHVWLSAKTGVGLAMLRDVIIKHIGNTQTTQTPFIARERHLRALEKTQRAIQDGLATYKAGQALELLAEQLQQAQQSLGEITGEFSADDLLGEIFSSFCIGK